MLLETSASFRVASMGSIVRLYIVVYSPVTHLEEIFFNQSDIFQEILACESAL
jgi:hypothetical protein